MSSTYAPLMAVFIGRGGEYYGDKRERKIPFRNVVASSGPHDGRIDPKSMGAIDLARHFERSLTA